MHPRSHPLNGESAAAEPVARTISRLAAIYLVMGLVGLQLAIPPSTASPLFPAAGFALATALWYGWPAVFATFVGQFLMHMVRCWYEGNGWPPVQLILATGFAIGAAAQAAAAATLVKRWTGNTWRELAFERQLFGFLIVGGGIACVISSSVGSACLGMAGFVPLADLPYEGWKWYVGDTLGVFIFAPLTLVLLAGRGHIWQPANRRVLLKMLTIFALVMVAFAGASRWEQAARLRQLANEGESAAARLADRLQQRVQGVRLMRSLLDDADQPAAAFSPTAGQWLRSNPDADLLAWWQPPGPAEDPIDRLLIQSRPDTAVAAGLPATATALAQAAVNAGTLLSEQRLPQQPATPPTGLLLAVPGGVEVRSSVAGCLVAGLDQQRLLKQAIPSLPDGLTLWVGELPVGDSTEDKPPDAGQLQWTGRLPVDWLDWQLELTADSSYLKGDFDVTWIVAILSLLFAALFADRDVAISAAVSREEIAREEKQQLERELLIAQQIQKGLLPRRPPALPGFELAGSSQPAAQTGGDFYDLVPLPDGRLAVAIADVTGHGLGPALVAAEVRALFRALIGRGEPLGQVVAAMHRLLAADLPAERLVTACFAVLDAASGQLEYLSAGHGPLLVCRGADGVLEDLPAQSLPFGFLEEPPAVPAARIKLEPGDVFMLITDGFFEATNASGRPFGVAAVGDVITQHRKTSADRLIASLELALADFLGESTAQDDLTAVVVKRVAGVTKPKGAVEPPLVSVESVG